MIQGSKVSELAEDKELTGQEYIPLIEDGKNKKVKTGLFALKKDLSNEIEVTDGEEPTDPNTEIWVNRKGGKPSYIDRGEAISVLADNGLVTAAALLEQAKDIDSLKSVVMTILKGLAYLDSVNTRKLNIDGAEMILKGESTPSESPDFVGQFYIDKSAKISYIATGNGSISDWKPINKA